MLKLRFSEPFHKTYMDGKISVCKYDCTLVNNQTKQVIAEFTVTGTAKCAPNDAVNADFGAKLADSRAKLLAYKKAANYYPHDMLEVLAERINNYVEILEFAGTMHYLKKKEIDHIEDICSEV